MSKKDYQLLPNEVIIYKENEVGLSGGMTTYFTNELILTNLNLVLIKNGVFGKFKGIDVYPLNQIKRFDNKPQILLSKNNYGHHLIEVFFINQQIKYVFSSKKRALVWQNKINQVVLGQNIEYESSRNTVNSSIDLIVDTFSGTINTLKDSLGINSKSKEETDTIKTARKCIYCGAPISGTKEKVIQCSYCNGEQTL